VNWQIIAVPTVLDSLRRHLLGDEAADRLELAVAILTAQTLGKSRRKIRLRRPDRLHDSCRATPILGDTLFQAEIAPVWTLNSLEMAEPSDAGLIFGPRLIESCDAISAAP